MKTESISISSVSNLGDKRLNTRLGKLIDELTNDVTSTIPNACKNTSSMKGAYRFFSNKKVSASAIIEAHFKTMNLSAKNKGRTNRILVLSDTTELDYTGKRASDNLGCLNYENRKGILFHNSMIVSEVGVPLGHLKQTYWGRNADYFGKSDERRKWPLEEKESFRWYDHYKATEQLCEQDPDLEAVYIGDREADFMELLAARTCPNAHMLIRSQYNRNLKGEKLKLYDFLAQQPLEYTYTISIIHPKTKKARLANLEVRFTPVTLELQGKHPSGCIIEPVTLNAIEVREINPPQDIDEPIKWVLLTTLDVHNQEQAEQIIGYYILRWLIERFFYLLKTGGSNVQELQLKTQDRLENAIATYSISVMNVMKMRYLSENHPDTPINEVGITPEEHQALYTIMQHRFPNKIKYDPNHIPTVKEYCIVLGRLGGFQPSKRQPLPGLKILTRAFDKYYLILDAFFITHMSKN